MTQRPYPPLAITPHWATVQEHVLQIVDLVPRGRMDWTPKPDLWNFRGILIHIADARDGWMAHDVNDGEPYPNIWTTARSRDDIKRELARTWERLNRFLSNQSQLEKTYTSGYDGGSCDGHWIAFHLLEHDIHHRAELLQRLALLDVEHGIDM